MKEVTVKKEHYDGNEEYYGPFYNCPKCEVSGMAYRNYCHNCGVRLKWEVE